MSNFAWLLPRLLAGILLILAVALVYSSTELWSTGQRPRARPRCHCATTSEGQVVGAAVAPAPFFVFKNKLR
jgi:hypothetical protein